MSKSSSNKSNEVKNRRSKVKLGHPDYIPSDSEVKKIIRAGKKGAIALKKAIFYIWQYNLHKREPYSCKTIVEFVGKYFGLSKATFYRQLSQVLINHEVHGKFGGEDYICDYHCQRLSRYSKVIEKKGETLKSFWDFMVSAEGKNITAETIEKYALLLAYSGHLMTLEEGRKLDLPLHKLVDESIPKVVKELNEEVDSTLDSSASNKNEEEKESINCTSGLKNSDLKDILFTPSIGDGGEADGVKSANQIKEKKQTKKPESKRIAEASEFDIAMVSCQANYSSSFEKVVVPLIKLVENKKLKAKDLMELQNIIDIYLNGEL